MNIEKVKDLHQQALQGKMTFEDFSEEAIREGLERVYLDLNKRTHVFYSSEDSFEDVLPSHYEYTVAPEFAEQRLKDAIRAFDSKEIPIQRFVFEVAASGICFAYCFFKQNRAIYIAMDGDFYLEQW